MDQPHSRIRWSCEDHLKSRMREHITDYQLTQQEMCALNRKMIDAVYEVICQERTRLENEGRKPIDVFIHPKNRSPEQP